MGLVICRRRRAEPPERLRQLDRDRRSGALQAAVTWDGDHCEQLPLRAARGCEECDAQEDVACVHGEVEVEIKPTEAGRGRVHSDRNRVVAPVARVQPVSDFSGRTKGPSRGPGAFSQADSKRGNGRFGR